MRKRRHAKARSNHQNTSEEIHHNILQTPYIRRLTERDAITQGIQHLQLLVTTILLSLTLVGFAQSLRHRQNQQYRRHRKLPNLLSSLQEPRKKRTHPHRLYPPKKRSPHVPRLGSIRLNPCNQTKLKDLALSKKKLFIAWSFIKKAISSLPRLNFAAPLSDHCPIHHESRYHLRYPRQPSGVAGCLAGYQEKQHRLHRLPR